MEAPVVEDNSPTVRMRQLGMELRRYREAASKSQRDAADWLGYSSGGHTQISKIERGQRPVRVDTVKALCQLYGVTDPVTTEYLEGLARDSRQHGWWVEYGDTVPEWFGKLLGIETSATEVWTYESEYVPGLLQAEGYVRAIAAAATRSDADRFSALRADRQKRLTDSNPLILRAVLNEAVLCRRVGLPDVMHQQVRHIIDIAALPNVTVQVLPFSVGAHPAMSGPFSALRFPGTPTMDTVYLEFKGGAIYKEKPADVERYTTSFERLTDLALDEEETLTYLENMERRYTEWYS
jgi:transcriptional regulator with XRE-family HTH domain